MTRIAAGLLLALAWTAPATAADGTWQGTLHCDIIPGILSKPLVQPFQLDVRGGVARYERNVRMPDTTIASGYRESGEGQVGADGRLAVRGSGMAENATYTSDYTGILPPNGGLATLSGAQHWRFARHPAFDRPCDITLRRTN